MSIYNQVMEANYSYKNRQTLSNKGQLQILIIGLKFIKNQKNDKNQVKQRSQTFQLSIKYSFQ
ncbi:unnamed protein product [Paramecium sonneborni]|uniref:Uncharacterized protein n=1 Tax=Paramecium sonneborni TaxID=65129 RepID=A0A8S1QWV9_9CILI|nr:unnamed protein product [Paramecium sonneborni]